MSVPEVWHQSFTVRAYEVGPDERASVLTVADLLQEAAGEHARAAGLETFDLDGGTGTWVLTRLRLRIDDLPAMRETVEVETWPSGRDGLRATRDYHLRGADGRTLVTGTSAWLVLHVERRRPVRLPEAVVGFGPEAPRRVLPFGDEPTAPASVAAERAFAVRRSDLDRVGHANNVRFVEWTLEALDTEAGLREVDVAFRAEAVYGDTVVSQASALVGGTRAHVLSRASDGRTLALARTVWI
ncbi:MAG: acyl-ACP thioesterase domain-containing protein [Bacteroidota bacterium]